MGGENSIRSRPKSILKTCQSFKSDTISSLSHEKVERRSRCFSVYFMKASKREFWNHKTIGTLSQMASTKLNNHTSSHKVKNTWIQQKAAFENIIRSAGARIAATMLRVFASLPLEETGRFASFTADEIVLHWPLVQFYLLHPTSHHNMNN